MTNKAILAMNEYMKAQSVPALELMKKYDLTPQEFWSAYSQMRAKTPK